MMMFLDRNSGLVIREAEESDLSDVLDLYAQLGQDNGDVLPVSDAMEIFGKMKTYPDYRLYVATYGGKAVGSFTLLVMDNLAHLGAPSAVLEDVVVRETLRGQGVGTAMMAFAGSLARAKGCYKLAFSSNKNRTRAHGFYEKLGFEIHGYSFLMDLGPQESDRTSNILIKEQETHG